MIYNEKNMRYGIHLDETQCIDNMRSIIHIIFVGFCGIYHVLYKERYHE